MPADPFSEDVDANTPIREDIDGDGDRDNVEDQPVTGFESSAALVLVPEPDEDDPDVLGGSPNSTHSPFDIYTDSDDDNDEDEDDSDYSSDPPTPIPPMSSLTVFLYLLSPFLKLGALLLPSLLHPESDSGPQPLPRHLSALVIVGFAVLAAFTRHIWYMLARYVRRADLEEIVLEAFAYARGRAEKRRQILRAVVRAGTAGMRVLLGVVYIRASVDALLPLLPHTLLLLPARVFITILLALLVFPLYWARSLNTTRVVSATWLSIASYIAWFISIAFAHSRGYRFPGSSVGDSLGSFWESIPVIALTFSTYCTIPLYSSLKLRSSSNITSSAYSADARTKPRRPQSFKILSLLSVVLALCFILPLAFFSTDEPPTTQPSQSFLYSIPILTSITLLLALPSILLTAPPFPLFLPVSVRRVFPPRTSVTLSKLLIYLLTIGLSLLPRGGATAISDIALGAVFAATYVLPAILHITLHTFKRPLSILIPRTPLPGSSFSSANLLSNASNNPESRTDELLLRKERTLQRRRLGRRLVWDLGVWLVLVPVGGAGVVWGVGRVAGAW